MFLTKEVAIAITNLVTRKIAQLSPQLFIGVIEAAEVIDANLSQVRSGDDLFRYVPKATSDSLAAGDQVFMIKGIGTPMMILGKVSGDITTATFEA